MGMVRLRLRESRSRGSGESSGVGLGIALQVGVPGTFEAVDWTLSHRAGLGEHESRVDAAGIRRRCHTPHGPLWWTVRSQLESPFGERKASFVF